MVICFGTPTTATVRAIAQEVAVGIRTRATRSVTAGGTSDTFSEVGVLFSEFTITAIAAGILTAAAVRATVQAVAVGIRTPVTQSVTAGKTFGKFSAARRTHSDSVT